MRRSLNSGKMAAKLVTGFSNKREEKGPIEIQREEGPLALSWTEEAANRCRNADPSFTDEITGNECVRPLHYGMDRSLRVIPRYRSKLLRVDGEMMDKLEKFAFQHL
ncbi:hypothetical protein HNY73_002453 [Argiope bruennichi]|uniref:Uncharacterized protein n=1 Tax=Argiope bruennichi TaxID=94029 RepID=A0A8T0FUN0_ARGBR|nr:hypothetical protein HNY73_002453 [Argiope bruennichi]